MKKKILRGKLTLKKDTISNLNMRKSKGGNILPTDYGTADTSYPATCNCPYPPPNNCERSVDYC